MRRAVGNLRLGFLVLIVAVFAVVVLIASQGSADLVWLNGKTEPAYGWRLEQNESQVRFQMFDQMSELGRGRIAEFPRGEIVGMVVNVDVARLERLKPTELAEYRDYAEELAVQKADPVARNLAMRLYVIASANSSGELRLSSLRGLISLAKNDQERARWMTLLKLADQSRVAASVQDSEATDTTIPDAAKQMALRVVRLIRQGNGLEAFQRLNADGAAEALRHWKQVCSIEELKRIAQLNRPTLEQLHKLLQVELSIVKGQSPAQIERTTQGADWGEYAFAGADVNGTIPTFRNATKFDPAKSLFRNGEWIRP